MHDKVQKLELMPSYIFDIDGGKYIYKELYVFS